MNTTSSRGRLDGPAFLRRYVCGTLVAVAVVFLSGCNATQVSPAAAAPPSARQTYFAPAVSSNLKPATFAFDHAASTFAQLQYLASAGNEQYVANSGSISTLPNGILGLGITYGGGTGAQGTLYSPAQPGSWAVEWLGQIGLVGMLGQPFVPIVPNQVCPSLATAEVFQFVTLPLAGDKTNTAYGSVSIAAGSGSVSFTNITQLNISGGAAINPSMPSVSGSCSSTFFGQTISVPNVVTVANPGNGQTQTSSSTIVIGPTGFLVEDDGYTSSPAAYQNVLGAGTGAIGLPVQSSALSTSSLIAARYNGFIYGTGAAGNNIKNLAMVPASSRISSFGFADTQAACLTPPAPQTSTILYGGEFAGNDPSASSISRCDLAIDFGPQDSKTNGLYPTTIVWLGSGFPGNTTGKSYSFSAIAIAGQVQGKYAIFLIGLDTFGLQVVSQGQQSQDWGIYLLQSN